MNIHRVATQLTSLRKKANKVVELSGGPTMSESEDIVVLHLPFGVEAPWSHSDSSYEYGHAEIGFHWIPPSFQDFNDNNPRVQVTHIDGYELSDSDLQKLIDAGLAELVKNEVFSEIRNEQYEPWRY